MTDEPKQPSLQERLRAGQKSTESAAPRPRPVAGTPPAPSRSVVRPTQIPEPDEDELEDDEDETLEAQVKKRIKRIHAFWACAVIFAFAFGAGAGIAGEALVIHVPKEDVHHLTVALFGLLSTIAVTAFGVVAGIMGVELPQPSPGRFGQRRERMGGSRERSGRIMKRRSAFGRQ